MSSCSSSSWITFESLFLVRLESAVIFCLLRTTTPRTQMKRVPPRNLVASLKNTSPRWVDRESKGSFERISYLKLANGSFVVLFRSGSNYFRVKFSCFELSFYNENYLYRTLNLIKIVFIGMSNKVAPLLEYNIFYVHKLHTKIRFSFKLWNIA